MTDPVTGSRGDPVTAPSPHPPGPVQRLLAGFAYLVAGAATGLAGAVVHASWWGFALTAAASVAALVALPATLGGRGVFALGWVVLVGLAVLGRPEGDYAVSQDLWGIGLLGLVLLVAVVGVVTVATSGRRPAPPPG